MRDEEIDIKGSILLTWTSKKSKKMISFYPNLNLLFSNHKNGFLLTDSFSSIQTLDKSKKYLKNVFFYQTN